VQTDEQQRREFHEALLEADAFEGFPGKWQAAIRKQKRRVRSCAWSTATRTVAATRS
jgi:hypothetical protein